MSSGADERSQLLGDSIRRPLCCSSSHGAFVRGRAGRCAALRRGDVPSRCTATARHPWLGARDRASPDVLDVRSAPMGRALARSKRLSRSLAMAWPTTSRTCSSDLGTRSSSPTSPHPSVSGACALIEQGRPRCRGYGRRFGASPPGRRSPARRVDLRDVVPRDRDRAAAWSQSASGHADPVRQQRLGSRIQARERSSASPITRAELGRRLPRGGSKPRDAPQGDWSLGRSLTPNRIPPEVRLRIFEPFFTTNESGIGLGLSSSPASSRATANHRTSLVSRARHDVTSSAGP